jgi:DNA polymerase III gamma/tau subunit
LSVLDQTLAFGEGAVTAQRVRDALGWIGDEMYVELLDLVAERRSADVFPYIARLVDAGADLGEFVAGAGEALRAWMVHKLGGQPEGLTDLLREGIERHGEDLTVPDLLRMLRLLAETETAIRRSPLTRLHVETLLLQWTLLDRTVELAELLSRMGASPQTSGGGTNPGAGGKPSVRPTPRVELPPNRAPVRKSKPKAAPRPPEESETVPPPLGPVDLERVQAAWPRIVDEVGARRRLVRESLLHARPVALDGDELTLEVDEAVGHREGLERSRSAIAKAILTVVGRSMQLVFREGQASSGSDDEPEAKRLDDTSDREERLRLYRRADAALDAAADALDLELLE